MNGFDVNPDRWFCDVFAYPRFGGHGDYEWLADWESLDYDDMKIIGLELLQDIYAGKTGCEDRYADAKSVCDLLVVIKFQRLIRRASPFMRELRFPLLTTAHDYDFIDEVHPQ